MSEVPGVHFVTEEEGRELYDQAAQDLLGITGEEFLRRWDEGEFRVIADYKTRSKVQKLVMLMPFAGRW